MSSQTTYYIGGSSAMVSLIESRTGKVLLLLFELSINIGWYPDHAVIDSQMLFVDSTGHIKRWISPGYET